MITIKLPYNTTDKFYTKLLELRKQQSSVVRFSFNRYHDGVKQKEIRNRCKKLNNFDKLNSWLLQCGIMEGAQLYTRFKHKPNIIFGSKFNFNQRIKNKITKEEYQLTRLLPLNVQGATSCGNRNFELNIIDENFILFKPNRKEHYILHLPKLRSNIKKQLFKLQELVELKQLSYSIKLSDKYVAISFNLPNDNTIKNNKTCYIGIDLNPDNIGISICNYENDNHKIICTKMFDISQIFNKFVALNEPSYSIKSKYYQNKLQFETIEISKQIIKLAKQYKVSNIFIEKLDFNAKVANTFNNIGNRKCKNIWKRELFIEQLSKRCKINSIAINKIRPAYTSFIGNIQYNYADSINASIEIGRRGYELKINNNTDRFYPAIVAKHQWKEMAATASTWKSLFSKIKNLKLKYRVQLEDALSVHKHAVFSLNHAIKSKVKVYNFDNVLMI